MTPDDTELDAVLASHPEFVADMHDADEALRVGQTVGLNEVFLDEVPPGPAAS
jgi:hypothetical protein